MYETNANSTLDVYGSFIEGNPHSLLLALSANPLNPTTREALEKSAAALGWNENAWAFAVLQCEHGQLGSDEVLGVVEGLDPLALVAADAQAAQAFGKAYRSDVPLDGSALILGRSVISFANLEALMDTPQNKQKAWALLKKLPKPSR